MLETPHVAVGAAIGLKVVNPALALPLALGSHFILDQILHWNPHTYTETLKYGHPTRKSTIIAGIDASLALLLGLSVSFFVLPNYPKAVTIILSCLFSVLPDILKFPFYYLNSKNKLVNKWVNVERKLQVQTDNVKLGLFTQITIIIAAFYWMIS